MYSLMAWAGHMGGTWYPSGGMTAPAEALARVAQEAGARLLLNADVRRLECDDAGVRRVCTAGGDCEEVAAVVAAADYHHVEQVLLPPHLRRYSPRFWHRSTLSPHCFVYYLGIRGGVSGLLHHTFFFDEGLDLYLRAVFDDDAAGSQRPAFYVCDSSHTDPTVAPEGGAALFVLVPVAPSAAAADSEGARAAVLRSVLMRLESVTGQELRSRLAFSRSYGPRDWAAHYNAFRGNAFGLANTLSQSLLLRPSMDSLAHNLVFAGHLTTPGPGVPPAMVSGILAARVLDAKLNPPWYRQAFAAAATGTSWCAMTAMALAFVGLLISAASPAVRSYALCVRLMRAHGRTFFAAACLMDLRRFLDTAAIYALFRVADDCVDAPLHDAARRRADLDQFAADFWRSWERGAAAPDSHPVLLAAVSAGRRHGYTRRHFEVFFRSMEMDAEDLVCASRAELMQYIEGSAAVIGDCMLPILMQGASPEQRAAALPHARDLGRAFQITNMVRDVGEDLDLRRQYIPADICARHGVDLRARDPAAPGHAALIEEMLAMADGFYQSGDVGVAMLPAQVRELIGLARTLYHGIHAEVRRNGYDVFSRRARVGTARKLRMALPVVGPCGLARIVAAELAMQCVEWLALAAVPLAGIALAAATTVMKSPNCTYLRFHLYFTLPAVGLLWGAAWLRSPGGYVRRAAGWSAVLCTVATAYTFLWDAHLVAAGVWSYPPGRVLGSVLGVPVEEVAFFSLATLLAAGVWLALFPQPSTLAHRPPTTAGPPASGVQRMHLLVAALGVAGGALAAHSATSYYLGITLVWAAPVLLFQLAVGSRALAANAFRLSAAVALSTLHLSIADRWAIQNGIWDLSTRWTLPELIDGLPTEEIVFFAMTNALCGCGLTLAMTCSAEAARGSATSALAAVRLVHAWDAPPDASALPASAARLHSAAANAAALAAVAASAGLGFRPAQDTQLWALVGSTCLVGLPHGALDAVLMRGPLFGAARRTRVIATYLALIWATFLVWRIAPELALFGFLLQSVWHFGEGDTCGAGGGGVRSAAEIVARGGAFLSTVHSHPRETWRILLLLLGGDESGLLRVLAWLRGVHACQTVAWGVTVVARAFGSRGDPLVLLELVTVRLLFHLTPPLVAFAVYFNMYHAPRHIARVWRFTHQRGLSLGLVWGKLPAAATVATLGAAVCCVLWMRVHAGAPWDHAVLRALFIGLSMITTPHMAVVELLRRREAALPQPPES
eukprot:TRINITY_DN34691_c0_g1_i3.p1 TRINITY_DN34691_c0_g1~~TRINITY_DN34691_c0_g1_i3.p1  ORF type:complete len:1239 (+),score=248.19 TRINITY_DN34691_c0_g1_i3:604-4320(+)